MLTPKDTVKFLNELEADGFMKDHLRVVHFKPTETITTHRTYGEAHSKFEKNGRNMIVCQRLQFIVKHKNCISSPDDFMVIAKIAETEFPFIKK